MSSKNCFVASRNDIRRTQVFHPNWKSEKIFLLWPPTILCRSTNLLLCVMQITVLFWKLALCDIFSSARFIRTSSSLKTMLPGQRLITKDSSPFVFVVRGLSGSTKNKFWPNNKSVLSKRFWNSIVSGDWVEPLPFFSSAIFCDSSNVRSLLVSCLFLPFSSWYDFLFESEVLHFHDFASGHKLGAEVYLKLG